MADIDILAGLADVVFDDDEDGGSSCPDDDLTPLQKLEKYVDSDNIFSRQMVARSLLETVRWAGENNENAHLVLKAMVRLSEDIEPTVRAELMEQLPHIAMYCQENKGLFQDSVSSYLLPIVVRYLNDTNSQVRKTSQAALLVLLEQDLLESVDLEEQVCPVILELASPDSIDDFRTEAVALMSKMAPLVGRDLTIRLFLPRFSALCTDAFFHVRKVCASNFGDVCTVVGQQHTEEELLPKFHFLCEDGVWGVRKACAECFMAVSYACSLEVRQGELAQLFLGLVCDQSRWVRMAAFQALGGFISTFADPGTTGLYFSEEGVLVAGNPEEFHSNRNPTKEEIEKSGELRKNEEAEVTQELLESTMVDSCPLASPESMDIDNSFDDSIESSDLICHSKDRSVEEIRAASYAHDSDNTSSIDQSSNISNSVEQTSDSISVDTSTSAEQTSTGPPKNTVKGDIGDEAFKSSNDSGVDLNSPTSVEPECGDSGQGDKNQLSPALELEEIEITAEDDQSAVRFNDFNYWHTPLPEIDEDLKGGKASMAVIQETDSNDNVKGCDRNLTECVQENKLASGIEELKLESTNVESKEHSDSVESKTSEESNESINEESRTSSQTPAESENTDVKEPSQTCDTTPTEGADDSEDKKNGNAEVPLDMDSQSSNEETSKEETKVAKVEEIQLDSESDNLLFTASVSDADGRVEGVENIGSTHFLGQQINESTMTVIDGVVKDDEEPGDDLLKDTLSKDQDVIPSALLEHYLSMTDPSRAQTVDTDIVKHCAFSLPAVAYTLGRKNWPCLRDLYEALAADMQWKVRRTLAFSIHELAVIVGDQITHKDLVPVFNGFLKDLDEVRIGVLKHLADFLKLLKQEVRDEYLSKIPDFMTTDNNRNWRFRLELSEQLIMLLGLYSAQDISQHLLPVAMQMTEDKVAEVRQAAFRVLSQMLKKFHSSGDFELVSSFNKDICKQLAESKKWNKRQMFAQLCMQILAEGSIPQAQFAKELLPALRSLGWDSVANVRISLAKTLAQNIIPTGKGPEFFTSYQNPYHEELLSIVQQLKMDEDRDVRYFISQPPQTDLEDMVPV